MVQEHYTGAKKWKYILQIKCQRSVPSHFMVPVFHFINVWHMWKHVLIWFHCMSRNVYKLKIPVHFAPLSWIHGFLTSGDVPAYVKKAQLPFWLSEHWHSYICVVLDCHSWQLLLLSLPGSGCDEGVPRGVAVPLTSVASLMRICGEHDGRATLSWGFVSLGPPTLGVRVCSHLSGWERPWIMNGLSITIRRTGR